MKIFREEKFGGVIYDSETLRFNFTNETPAGFDNYLPLKINHIRSDILSAPVRIYFEITRQCNLNCRHCFVSASNDEFPGLEKERIFAILDDLKKANIIDVRFTGGEPTFRDDWFEILFYAKKKGFIISLNTNGVYDNPLETITLMEHLDLDQITISLDGLQKNHDFIRGKGSFVKTTDAIKVMAKRGLKLRFNMVLNKKNINDLPEILKFSSKYAKEINFFYMRAIGRAKNIKDLSISFWEHYNSAKYALGNQTIYPNINIMHFEQSFIERSISKESHDEFGLLQTYPYGSTTLNIAADGTYWPHGYSPYQMEELILGNALENSILDIWHNSRKLDRLREWFSQLRGICSGCEYYMNECAGINFESEISKMKENEVSDRLCIKDIDFPTLNLQDL